MGSQFNLAGTEYSLEWHDKMQSFLVWIPGNRMLKTKVFVKVGGTLDVALINMWDYVDIPSCFSGDVSNRKSVV